MTVARASSQGVALVFPGQGSEEPGMGLALAATDARAARLLAAASDACGVDVARALERGGRALTRTEVVQPALVAVSIAVARALEDRGVSIACAIGHSLGELTAACFALDVPDEIAVAVAAARGRAMAQAAEACPGGMLALASTLVPAAPGLVLAAHNAPDELVLSGPRDAIVAVERALAPRARRLPVAGPWHSPAMELARPMLRAALAPLRDRALRCAFVSAVDARPVTDVERAIEALVDGLVRPVRWVETLGAVRDRGITELVAVAPSRVVRTLAKRSLGRSVVVRSVDGPLDLETPQAEPR